MDLFEEVAKLRAARRMWYRIATERFSAKDANSGRLRFFSGNSGTTLTAQQPLNNLIRSTVQCLGAVLGGAQSIHVMGYDEAFQIPSEEAVTLSLRTQQIVALESGVPRTADPLAGSYFVEHLTDELEARANDVLHEIAALGGAVAAIERGVPQRWIAESAYRIERAVGDGTRPRVGVNVHADPDEAPVELPRGVRPRRRRRRATGRAHRGPRRGARRFCVLGGDRGRRRGGARRPQRHARARGRRARGRDTRRAVGRVPRRVRRVPGAGSVVAPLHGLRVLDLTRFVAGSQATALLAALGADVVKLEVPPGGDPYRVQGTERLGDESVLFLSLNSGKRSVAIDFRSPSAADAVDRLLASADFVVENARPGSLAPYGLDWEQVHARYPSIVYGSISGYGDVGPQASRGGFDLILQAESGVMSVTGSEASGPVKVGAPVLDVGAGISCAFGLLAAHLERLRTGVGRQVSSSLMEFALTSLGTLAASTFVSGEVPGLLGTHSPTFAPYGGFRTADGWIVLAGAGSEDLWIRCCKVLGADALIDDPRFVDNATRVRNRDELTDAFESVLGREPSAHWLELLAAEGVPAAEVRDIDRVFADAQTAALGAVQTLHHPDAGDYRVVGVPVRFDRAPFPYPSPAPALGAHTREVLTDVGLSADAVDELVSDGVAIAP